MAEKKQAESTKTRITLFDLIPGLGGFYLGLVFIPRFIVGMLKDEK